MKIEMGESLFYSWLRHLKGCQVTQTNWKPSASWLLEEDKKLEQFMKITDDHFKKEYGYAVYGNNSLSQLLTQAEVDVLGIAVSEEGMEIYAVDVAFHENGLNYGSRQETVERVVKKFLRTALCIRGYFGITKAELIFASPKIHDAVINDLEPCIADLNNLFHQNNFNFSAQIIANENFNDFVLSPVITASDDVSDTSELFMRSCQLLKMFGYVQVSHVQRPTKPMIASTNVVGNNSLANFKVGEIAQTFLRNALERGNVSDEEIIRMQDKECSKEMFDINYSLLVSKRDSTNSGRYYASPLNIRGNTYYLCNDWYEKPANNDRPFLEKWFDEHK